MGLLSRQYLFHFLVMDGIVEGWMEFSSGSVWRVAVVQSGEDLANLIRTHWHDQITLIIIITIAIINNVIINRSQVKRWTTSPKWYQSKLGHVFVKRVNFSGEVLQIYVLNQFQGAREEKATFNWTILATALLPSAAGGGKWLLLIGI